MIETVKNPYYEANWLTFTVSVMHVSLKIQ